jgi:hypothetical protein
VSKPRALNRVEAKHNPARAFASPQEVVNEVLLTHGEKRATLDRWRLEILSELASVGEGMATRGVSVSRLRVLEEIESARARLT